MYSKVADGVSFLTDSVNDVSKGSCGVVWVNVDRRDSLHNRGAGGRELKGCFDEWDNDVRGGE